ncbi:cytochrome-c oxidase [Jannaschia formosa]|uniref:cytochrome-c oxidase n=1 Tax=Jannaschia formosa TaxID=2259592 RepID=UPI000E1C1786|nr:cytochrome-c oxidase [Jannaschia formosa]
MTDLSNRFFAGALCFFAGGVGVAVYMGQTQDFTLRPVHAHLNLLGWVSFFLYGAFHRFFPEAASWRLSQAHFWTALIGLPPFMVGLGLLVSGRPDLGLPIMLPGEALTVLSVALFLTVGFRALRGRRAPRAVAMPAE